MIIKKQQKQLMEAALDMKKNTEAESVVEEQKVVEPEEEIIDIFDLDKINFAQRQERRRGDRRRGYRRIDDRTLISRAQEEANTIREAAVQDGYNAGLEKAQSDIEDLKETLLNFIDAKKEVFDFIAPDILEISVVIAEKIIKKEVTEDPQIVLNNILEVLNSLSKEEEKITIKVNPSQLELAKVNLPEIINKSGIEVRVSLYADEEVDEGGCICITSNGVVNANITTQIEILKEALKGV